MNAIFERDFLAFGASGRFQLVRFSTDVESLFDGGTSVPASPANVQRARWFASRMVPAGGTAIHPALQEGLSTRRPADAGGMPRLLVCGATSAGIDLASQLAGMTGAPMIANVRALAVDGGTVVATSQLCGGKLLCQAEVPPGTIVTALAGVFPAEAGTSTREVPVEAVPAPPAIGQMRTTVARLLEPAAGDVDITRASALVAIGRGIQRKENLPLAEELATLLGGAVCASRPVIDQGWLPLSRQVGKSGLVVKPGLYLALGISGASEHVEGMKDAALIVAVNSDPQAPIFEVAHYGIVADLFEIVPPLIQALKERGARAA